MPDEVSYFSIAKLAISPGDVLVVKVRGIVSPSIAARAHDLWKGFLPPQTKMLVIDDTIDLSILTKAEIEEKVL